MTDIIQNQKSLETKVNEVVQNQKKLEAEVVKVVEMNVTTKNNNPLKRKKNALENECNQRS